MNFPENIKYTSEHEWIRVEGDIAYIGITDYAQDQLGDIVFVDIQTVGETLNAGEVFGTIEVVKTISDIFMPVGGEVLEQNEALEDQPELVNKDPYGEGWLIKIKPDPAADYDALLDAEGYKKLSKADKLRFFNIAQGSLEECRDYHVLSRDLGYLYADEFEYLHQSIEEASKFLNSYCKAIVDNVAIKDDKI